MQCPSCSAQINNDDVTCRYCGARETVTDRGRVWVVTERTTPARAASRPKTVVLRLDRRQQRMFKWIVAITLIIVVGGGFLILFNRELDKADRNARSNRVVLEWAPDPAVPHAG